MLRGNVLITALLVCGVLAVKGTRVPSVSTGSFKTGGVESTASAQFPHPAVEQPLLVRKFRRKPVGHRAVRQKLQTTTLRTTTRHSIIESANVTSNRENINDRRKGSLNISHKIIRRKIEKLKIPDSVGITSVNKTSMPENNSLRESIILKSSNKRKIRSRSRKSSNPHRIRLVSKERREFWKRLDQRERIRNDEQNISTRRASNGNKHTHNFKTKNETESKLTTDVLYEDFPFLADHYDYNYYYYEDFSKSSTNESPIIDSRNMAQPNESAITVTTKNETIKTIDFSIKKNSVIQTTPKPEVLERANTSKINLSKTLLENLILIPKLQARIMPKLTAEETKKIELFADAPIEAPMTAIDSFRNRRQHNGNQMNKPRDILKEFPIFRHFKLKNDTNTANRKIIALHQRLQSHLTSKIVSASITHPNNVSTTSIPEVTVSYNDTIVSETTETTDSTLIETTTYNSETNTEFPTESPSVIIDENNNVNETLSYIEFETTTILPENFVKDPLEVSGVFTHQLLDSMNEEGSIKTNITFSTSKTEEAIETSHRSSFDLKILHSQLGNAPLGDTPFGLTPFGDAPMGNIPFGILPEGIAPLGNETIAPVLEDNTDPDLTQDGADGRYHVQVTGPDGSINGDYIVVDPVTGDLNGVRYEAAQDVDPLLVQRALLNFLSLDPRLSPENIFAQSPEQEPPLSISSDIIEPAVPPETITLILE